MIEPIITIQMIYHRDEINKLSITILMHLAEMNMRPKTFISSEVQSWKNKWFNLLNIKLNFGIVKFLNKGTIYHMIFFI